MNDDAMIQTAMNAGFGAGELYSPGGRDVREWQEVARRRQRHKMGEVPQGVLRLTCAVDVQKSGLYYSIRGWGTRASSWQIESGELAGYTNEPEIWNDLANLLTDTWGGMPIALSLIDSGFRPNKPDEGPINVVYDFCRRFRRFVRPTKGYATLSAPIMRSKIKVALPGKAIQATLELVRPIPTSGNSVCTNACRGRRNRPAVSCSRRTLPTIIASNWFRRLVRQRQMVYRNGSWSPGEIIFSMWRPCKRRRATYSAFKRFR